MSVLVVPKADEQYPSLGKQVADFIEAYLVHGPGDLLGQPVRLDDEKKALLQRMYEVFPRKHEHAGRRRFTQCAISLRKGSAKTEFGAFIAIAELHPEGPVRCDGFDARGQPVGVGVVSPYIPLVAYTEEQSDDLAYSAMKAVLERCPLGDDFDIGLERIMRVGGDGKAVSLAAAPDSRDGALTTFELCDETHRWNLPRLKRAYTTMKANLAKRKIAQPWMLEVTTAYSPGEGSVAEDTHEYAKLVKEGKIKDSRLFFFHRQAGEYDLEDVEQLREAVLEASGKAVATWSDVDAIVAQWQDPKADRSYLERVWLNRPVRAADRAFDIEQWNALARPDFAAPKGSTITLGYDGARWRDSVALVATHVESGHQWLAGLWEKPLTIDEWEAPDDEIDGVVDLLFEDYQVARMYCDPPYWETQVATWAGRYGDKRVVEWWTNKLKPMGYAIKSFATAIRSKQLSHDGGADYARHIGNAMRKKLNIVDESGEALYVIFKEKADSPFKIDAAMAGILSWEARNDALASGETSSPDLNEVIKSGKWGM